jgi:hypothetical protein
LQDKEGHLKYFGALSYGTTGSSYPAFRCKSSLRFAALWAFRFNPAAGEKIPLMGEKNAAHSLNFYYLELL